MREAVSIGGNDVGLLSKVINLFTKIEPKPLAELDLSPANRDEKRKVAAIAAALHHHSTQEGDVRAKVAAIAAALHHHELENSVQNKGLATIASLVAAIHHHNKKTK